MTTMRQSYLQIRGDRTEACVHGFVVAVTKTKKERYRKHAGKMGRLFIECEALKAQNTGVTMTLSKSALNSSALLGAMIMR